MTVGDLIGLGLLVLVLAGYWLLGRHVSRQPRRFKVRRPKQRTQWLILWWTLPL